MNDLKHMKMLCESIKRIDEGQYWNHTGDYEKQAQQLQKLVPPSGPSKLLKGEIFRAASKIYHDYYNNGFGNVWPGVATFLMSHVNLSPDVRRMLFDHAMGNIGDGIDGQVEKMMNETIEQIYEMDDVKNTVDMWDTKYNAGEFEPNQEDYDDWEDEEGY